jgi:hypothetical protein
VRLEEQGETTQSTVWASRKKAAGLAGIRKAFDYVKSEIT